MQTLLDTAITVIMADWQWRPFDKSECKFCGNKQWYRNEDKHWKHCPRLIWSIMNGSNTHSGVKYNTLGPYLSNAGAEVMRILSEYDPAIYKSHYDAYLTLRAYTNEPSTT